MRRAKASYAKPAQRKWTAVRVFGRDSRQAQEPEGSVSPSALMEAGSRAEPEEAGQKWGVLRDRLGGMFGFLCSVLSRK